MIGPLLARWTILTPRHLLRLPPRAVVLTFDDGPNPHHFITARLLDILRDEQVKACFCVIGRQVEQNPELLRRMEAEGHLLANHTHSHHFPLLQSKTALAAEIDACDRAMGAALGLPNYRSRLFRPPYGLLTWAVRAIVRERGLTVVPVSCYAFNAGCGSATCPGVVPGILRNADKYEGGVYVLHDKRYVGSRESPAALDRPTSGCNRDWVPDAVRELIGGLRSRGLSLLDPKEWLGRGG
jgi:peptidoglycan/xylan/chitin deacetylase (PgdA/CDA1 family)